MKYLFENVNKKDYTGDWLIFHTSLTVTSSSGVLVTQRTRLAVSCALGNQPGSISGVVAKGVRENFP